VSLRPRDLLAIAVVVAAVLVTGVFAWWDTHRFANCRHLEHALSACSGDEKWAPVPD
jgi:hypothetical protein